MCFGNDSPPAAPYIPPPPPPPEILDFIDEVTGQQTITVVGADGKKRRIIQRLPRTSEEEQRFRAGEQLVASSLNNIQQLYKYDPETAVDYAPLIQTFANLNRDRMHNLAQVADIGNIEEDINNFKLMQNTLMDQQFAIQNRTTEDRLAHAGRGSGTFAEEGRAALARNQDLTRMQGNVNAAMYGEDLAAKRLNRNKQAFGLNEMGRQAQLEEAQTRYGLAKEHEADMERRRIMAIEENKGLLGIGSNMIGQDLNKALGGQTAALANQTFQMQANDSLGRYNADVNRQMANHKMAMEAYNAEPTSFGEFAATLAGKGAMAYFTGGASEMGRSQFGGSPSFGGGGNRYGMGSVGRMQGSGY
jgi:hypothetical protein